MFFIAAQHPLGNLRQQWQQAQADTVRIRVGDALAQAYLFAQPDSALYFARRVLHLAEKYPPERYLYEAYNRLGGVYVVQNHYLHAIKYFQKAQAGYEKTNHASRLPNVYNNQAVVYMMIEDYPKAEIYFKKAIQLYRRQAPKSLPLANTLSNLGQVRYYRKAYASAMSLYKQALAIYQEKKQNTGTILHNMAELYAAWDSLGPAQALLQESLVLKIQSGDSVRLATSYGLMAEIFLKKGLPNQAEEAAFTALKIALRYGLQREQLMSLKILHQVQAQKGQKDKAYENLLAYLKLNEEQFQKAKAKELARLELAYELRKIQSLNQNLRTQNKLQAQINEKSTQRNWVLVFGIIVLLGLLLVLGYAWRAKRIAFRNIQILHHQVQDLNADLENQVKERTRHLAESFQSLENYAFLTSHQLRRHVANLIGLMQILPQEPSPFLQQELLSYLKEEVQKIDFLLHEMNQTLEHSLRHKDPSL
ncbi:MAG: hypothetical protein OHK0053_07500 [Microscillaceae bacterium]